MKKLIIAVGLLCAAGAAKAMNVAWVTDSRKQHYAINIRQIVRSGNIARGWFFSVDKEMPTVAYGEAERPWTKSLNEYDCAQKRWRNIQQTQSDKYGNIETFKTPTSWSYVEPDSVGEEMMKAACAGGWFGPPPESLYDDFDMFERYMTQSEESEDSEEGDPE